MIDEKLIVDIRRYVNRKTGKNYFKDIRKSGENIIVTCPFHKQGQEAKPSASIRITTTEKVSEGQFHCFTCSESMMITQVIERLLGDLYDEDEVESLFGLSTLVIKSKIIQDSTPQITFTIPEKLSYNDAELERYKFYHAYMKNRRIEEETCTKYSIGYDNYSRCITFPIRDVNRYCIGVGRRSIDSKIYRYPQNMIKPLYRSI